MKSLNASTYYWVPVQKIHCPGFWNWRISNVSYGWFFVERPNLSLQWASYQIRKIACCACAGNARNIFPATYFEGNHKLAIPACTLDGGGNVSGILGAWATRNFMYLVKDPCHNVSNLILCHFAPNTRINHTNIIIYAIQKVYDILLRILDRGENSIPIFTVYNVKIVTLVQDSISRINPQRYRSRLNTRIRSLVYIQMPQQPTAIGHQWTQYSKSG